MKKTLKNIEMTEMLRSLQPILSHKDKLGYVAARNYRILRDCLTEYKRFRDGLIEKHGTDEPDENGIVRKVIRVGTPAFTDFCEELAPYNTIEHEVDLMTAKYEEAIGCLTGEEILSVDWMLED